MKKLLFILIAALYCTLGFAQQYWKVSDYSEKMAKNYFDTNINKLNPIEGIWQTSEGTKYAIEKDMEYGQRARDKYRVIVLEHFSSCWKLGEIQAFITEGSSKSVYSMKYFYKSVGDCSAVGSINYFLFLERDNLASYEDGQSKITMYKLYPRNASSSNNSTPSQAKGKWSGTGFFLSKNGYIITNHHVIDGAKSIRVTSVNGNNSKTYNAKVEVSDKQNDLAIIRITDYFSAINTIPYTFKFSVSNIGESCWVLGYPLIQTMGEDIKLTNGIISSKSGFDGNIAQYQISAPVQPGNSGGPVFDEKGNLIGIIQAKHGAAENASYAIKASYIRNLVDMLASSITYPSVNQLAGKSLPKQVELASKCVCMIICE